MRRSRNIYGAFVILAALLSGCGDGDGGGGGKSAPSLLIANTRGDNVVRIDQETGAFLGEVIAKGSGGLLAPDTMVIGLDADLYISSGDSEQNSAVLRYDGKTFAFKGKFASGGGLVRPYGIAFGPDGKLYVSSFLSDQLLRYDGTTGAFIDVFKTGDGQPGGLNGPNALTFGPDGKLYVTTEGSVAVDGKPTFPGLPSQVLRVDIETGDMAVFIDQPELSPAGLGFISLVGVVFGPDCEGGACDVFVSDFANDIRRYDRATGALMSTMSTNYSGKTPSENNLGSLAFGAGGRLFTVGFNADEATGHPGAVLRFDGATGSPLPASGQMGALLVPEDERLVRPIGVLALP
ncbi:Vgb family protein [Sorangium sp. So ce385]|uniref:Vgb family protein n=1 Tax=Sorangium sp. So ce385 TaxID=3133308 RepID=UPI003F5AFF6E